MRVNLSMCLYFLILSFTEIDIIKMTQSTVWKKFPYTIENIDCAVNEDFSKNYSDEIPNSVQIGPQKMVMPEPFREKADEYYNFELRPSDVIITGFPRSGTTFAENMVWLILNDLNIEKAAEMDYGLRIPLFEAYSLFGKAAEKCKILQTYISSLDVLKRSTDGRRVFKTHLHFNFLPANLFAVGCKIIYLARNPKDVAVSYYHLERNVPGKNFIGDFQTFYSYFRKDLVVYAPYWAHIEQGWEKRQSKNFKFLFYEDATKDLRKTVKDMGDFLDKDLSEIQLDLLENYLKFDTFKKYIKILLGEVLDENVDNHFIRRGKVGGWKEYFTEEMNVDADKWITDNVSRIGITGYPHQFE